MSEQPDQSEKTPRRSDELGEHLMLRLAEAEEMVRRTYLARLGDCQIVPFMDMQLAVAGRDTVRIGILARLVYEKKESTLENLMNIYAAVGCAGYGIVLVIRFDGKSTELCVGVRSDEEGLPVESGEKILMQAIAGHLSGSKYEQQDDGEIFYDNQQDRTSLLLDLDHYTTHNPTWAISALAGIPALKTDEREAFTQGLERFIDAMQGKDPEGPKPYTAILLADPVMPQRCAEIERGYEQLASALSGLVKQQISLGTNENVSMTRTDTEGVTKTISDSVALSQSHTEGSSWSHTDGTSKSTTRNWGGGVGAVAGGAIGAVAGFAAGPPGVLAGAKAGAAVGAVAGTLVGGLIGSKTAGTSTSDTKGGNESATSSLSITQGVSDSKNINISIGATSGKGTSTGISFETQDKSVSRIIERIDQQLKRIDEARAYGLWNAACYFLCDSRESAQTAASLFSGCMRGKESGVEDSAIVLWHKLSTSQDTEPKEARIRALEYLRNLHHPRLTLSGDTTMPKVCPSALLTGRELALLLHLPRRSVGGVTVIETTGFGRDVHRLIIEDIAAKEITKQPLRDEERHKGAPIVLGAIRHLFNDQPTDVDLDADKLVYHTLVTGTTGVGKTTGVKSLLTQCHRQGIPFLVVEPAKSEYGELLALAGKDKPVRRFQAGRRGRDCLRLNPLLFPEGPAVSLIEHIDRVCALFNAAFPMYAAMPQLLEEAIVYAYEAKGWDTLTSTCRGGKRIFPTLREVADLIPAIVERAGYRQEAQSTYVGALTTRLRSLMRGVLGFTFMAQEDEETPGTDLFDESCIINVSSVGSTEKRAVLMGLLMIRLQEHRVIQGTQGVDRLKHLMVLEEAHNILKRTAPHDNMENSNPQGQAVEYFANALAEMRAFGQGFVIVDQSASSLDNAVLKNTNTKIVFRAPFEADRAILGGSLALDEKQVKVLGSLENHTAVVKQNEWLEAVCCHFKKIDIAASAVKQAVPSKAGKRPPSDVKACMTAVLAGLFSGRISVSQTPPNEPEASSLSRWLDENVKEESRRKEIAEQLRTRTRRELVEIRPLLLALTSLKEMSRAAELCAASEQGVLNHLLLGLEEETGIADEQTLLSLAHQSLLCYGQHGLLEKTARMIENSYELGRLA